MSRATLLAVSLLSVCGSFGQNLALHLIATDSQGHPVTDLTPGEVRLTDEGKNQSVASFQRQAPRPTPLLAPGELTNRPAALANLHVVLFDLLNLPVSDRRTAADQLLRALQHLEHPESVYLYILSLQGELLPVRPLPNAAPVAVAAPEFAVAFEKAMGPVAAVRANFTTDVVFRSKTTYAALETLAGRLAPMPGYKTVSWITIGMPRSFPSANGEFFDSIVYLRQAAGKISQSGVALNPIATITGPDAPQNRETLQDFAELTGGKLYQGADIERAIPEVIQASQVSYRVEFTPKNWDGKFHKLSVISTRKGVTIRCEQGYLAQPPAALPELFQSPFDAAGIGIRATVSPGAQPNTLRLHLTLDPQDLGLDRPTQLTLSVTGYLPEGKTAAYPSVPINLNLTPEQREKARDGLRLGHEVTLAPGMRKVRLAIEDPAAKLAGTLTIPVSN